MSSCFNLGHFDPKSLLTISQNMPILTQTLKGHNSETVFPFELKFFVKTYFDQLYLGSTRNILGIDQSIVIHTLPTPALYYTIDDS
jgi:hypothetical protein